MQIKEDEGIIVFDHLVSVSASRGLRPQETLSFGKVPATTNVEKSVSKNAKGVFSERSIADIHKSAAQSAAELKKVLVSA